MLTLRVPASRRDRAAADLARCAGLSLVQSRRFGPCVWPGSARRVVAWMRSAAKAWLEIASTSGICVALQPDCVGSGASARQRVAGSERKLASLAYTARSFESSTSKMRPLGFL